MKSSIEVVKDIIAYGIIGWFILLVVYPFLVIARREVAELINPEEYFNI